MKFATETGALGGDATVVWNDPDAERTNVRCAHQLSRGRPVPRKQRRVTSRSAVLPLRSSYSQLVERNGIEPAERDATSATGANRTASHRSHNPSDGGSNPPRPIAAFGSGARRISTTSLGTALSGSCVDGPDAGLWERRDGHAIHRPRPA